MKECRNQDHEHFRGVFDCENGCLACELEKVQNEAVCLRDNNKRLVEKVRQLESWPDGISPETNDRDVLLARWRDRALAVERKHAALLEEVASLRRQLLECKGF